MKCLKLSRDGRQRIAAISVGAFYGLFIRFGFAIQSLHPALGIVSSAFLVVCPFSVGAIAVLWKAGDKPISLGDQLGFSIASMMFFLLAMFITFVEGLICIVLVLPVFVIASVVGGLIAGAVHNKFRARRSSLTVFAVLPLLLAPLEGFSPTQRSELTVTNTIYIAAPPDQVFDHLADVRHIKPEELGFTFVHLIGLPRPLEAQMSGVGEGSVRTSRWEKNVWFQEVITEWKRPTSMHYRFVIPKGAIPRDALDEHVEIGGEYFDLVDGGYDLKPAAAGGTELSLTTRFVNKSHLKLYGDIWGRMVLKDFHRSILGLMKTRSESGS